VLFLLTRPFLDLFMKMVDYPSNPARRFRLSTMKTTKGQLRSIFSPFETHSS